MQSNRQLNLNLFIPYILLSCLSLIMVLSVAPSRLAVQAISCVAGLTIFLYLSRQSPSIFKALSIYSYPLAILLLVLTFLLAEPVRGAARWISIGNFQLQTSEFAKPLFILGLAHLLTRLPPSSIRALLLHLGAVSLPFGLIFLEPDLGTSMVILSISAFELTLSSLPGKFWTSLLLFLALTIYIVPHFLAPYQLERLESFANPGRDPLGAGYNVIQSVIAVGSGGILGKGLGHGTQSHLQFLPERHTDFMFASLAEELGLLGSATTILLESYLIYYLLSKALVSRPFSRLVLGGVAGYLFFQTAVNLGMNLGIAPVTGVTLPLVSYGGSSVLAVSIALGLASSFAKDKPLPPTLEIV